MNIKLFYELFQSAGGNICTDSRQKSDGSIFFALRGDNFDGNQYAQMAIENGCSCAIIDDKKYAIGKHYIVVDNVLKTLQSLATYHRNQMDIPVIAITGTNGKTTTKELAAAVLKKKYKLLYTEGNFNNHIGVPLTLLRLKKDHEIALIEMGASHPGEIRDLANIACPTSGLITNVGKAHLEGFGSFESVVATKADLYQYLRVHGGTIFANECNQYLKRELITDDYIKYGIDSNIVEVWGHVESEPTPYLGMKWKTNTDKVKHIHTKLIGDYNAENVLAAITIGKHYGVGTEDINAAIEEYVPTNNRSQLMYTEKNVLIVDAYNANPTSVASALINFQKMQADDKYIILGDMLELGEQSEFEHINIVNLIKKLGFKNVLLVGTEFSSISTKFECFEKCEQLLVWLKENKINSKTILVKGSRGIGLERCIPEL